MADSGIASDDSWSTEALAHQRHSASCIESMCDESRHALEIFIRHAHPDVAALAARLWARIQEDCTTYKRRPDGKVEWHCSIRDGAEEANTPYCRSGSFYLQINENGRSVVEMQFRHRFDFTIGDTDAETTTSPIERKLVSMEIDERQSTCSGEKWKSSLDAFFEHFLPFTVYVPGSKRRAAA